MPTPRELVIAQTTTRRDDAQAELDIALAADDSTIVLRVDCWNHSASTVYDSAPGADPATAREAGQAKFREANPEAVNFNTAVHIIVGERSYAGLVD